MKKLYLREAFVNDTTALQLMVCDYKKDREELKKMGFKKVKYYEVKEVK